MASQTPGEAVITWTLRPWASPTQALSICSRRGFYSPQMNEPQLNSAGMKDKHDAVLWWHIKQSHPTEINVMFWRHDERRSSYIIWQPIIWSFDHHSLIWSFTFISSNNKRKTLPTDSPLQFSSLLSAPTKEKEPIGLVPPTSLACNRKPWNGMEPALRETAHTNPSLISS